LNQVPGHQQMPGFQFARYVRDMGFVGQCRLQAGDEKIRYPMQGRQDEDMALAAARNKIHDTFNGLFAVQTASANFDDTHTVAPMLQVLLLQTCPFRVKVRRSVGRLIPQIQGDLKGADRLVPRLLEKAVRGCNGRRWNKDGVAKVAGASTSQETIAG
jgi:hypothetical protein